VSIFIFENFHKREKPNTRKTLNPELGLIEFHTRTNQLKADYDYTL